jgi:uncharacterized small protein (DUF1192 family)
MISLVGDVERLLAPAKRKAAAKAAANAAANGEAHNVIV